MNLLKDLIFFNAIFLSQCLLTRFLKKEPIISIPKLGIINCHAGKLPLYRGRNVLDWVLINDEKEWNYCPLY